MSLQLTNKTNSGMLKKFYKQKKFKQITDLYSYIIKPEKIGNKILIEKFFFKDYILLSLSAIVWEIENFNDYFKIKSELKIYTNNLREVNYKEIKSKLLTDIYIKVIKNKIIMI